MHRHRDTQRGIATESSNQISVQSDSLYHAEGTVAGARENLETAAAGLHISVMILQQNQITFLIHREARNG